MKRALQWKRGTFSATSEIYSKETVIGSLKENSWKQSAEGEMNGKKYQFKTKGVFRPVTTVIDSGNNTTLGHIEYNAWMTRASIQLRGKSVHWKYDNTWNTRWSLSDSGRLLMKYQGSSAKGNIESDIDDDLLVLTGLFVTNYYRQMAVVILVAIMVPIFASVAT